MDDDADSRVLDLGFDGRLRLSSSSGYSDQILRAEAEMENLFTYQSLPDESIRTLHLLPGKADEDIQCCLVTVRLESMPPYEALSYAWGTSSELSWIELNGVMCLRRHNLLDCLKTLRHRTQVRTLWIDAICINQADVKEKSAQVELMPQIYRSAIRTLIWLGKDGTYAPPHFPVSAYVCLREPRSHGSSEPKAVLYR